MKKYDDVMKKCPFCDNDAILLLRLNGKKKKGYVIGCYNDKCIASYKNTIRIYKKECEAIDAWNNRDHCSECSFQKIMGKLWGKKSNGENEDEED